MLGLLKQLRTVSYIRSADLGAHWSILSHALRPAIAQHVTRQVDLTRTENPARFDTLTRFPATLLVARVWLLPRRQRKCDVVAERRTARLLHGEVYRACREIRQRIDVSQQ